MYEPQVRGGGERGVDDRVPFSATEGKQKGVHQVQILISSQVS